MNALKALQPRQGGLCPDDLITCGDACIEVNWSCCPRSDGGCPPGDYCIFDEAGGGYQCCEEGLVCIGGDDMTSVSITLTETTGTSEAGTGTTAPSTETSTAETTTDAPSTTGTSPPTETTTDAEETETEVPGSASVLQSASLVGSFVMGLLAFLL